VVDASAAPGARARRESTVKRFEKQQRESVARFRAASLWVAEHMPDMVDAGGEVCPFATHAAIDIKRMKQEVPTVDEVRRYRRERWAHIREEEEA
jgi:hypothetical protein